MAGPPYDSAARGRRRDLRRTPRRLRNQVAEGGLRFEAYLPPSLALWLLDRMAGRLAARPDILDRRRESVEHPFGTIKQWMNQGAFLMRRLGKCPGRVQPDRACLQHQKGDHTCRRAGPDRRRESVTGQNSPSERTKAD